MCCPKIWQPKCVLFKLVDSTLSQSSSAMSKYGTDEFTPAQLTRISTRPRVRVAASKSECTLWRSTASTARKEPSPPAARMASSLARPRSAPRPATITNAPARASPSASAPPNTPVPPTTTAVRSARLNMRDRNASLMGIPLLQFLLHRLACATPTTRCGMCQPYQCVGRCGRRSNPAAPGGDWPGVRRGGSRRSRTMPS